MRVPLSWLREYAPVQADAAAVAERLIRLGFEVDRIVRIGAPDEGRNHEHFRIGRVVEFDRHPNADRLRLCRVDVGETEPRQIVCGASNFAAGDTVVVALPGAVLPGADRPLKRAKLRGEVSDGMMLSERELQLSNEHDGIIVLRDAYEVGSPLRDHVALEDEVLDVEITSNRGDCLSIYGLAREVAAGFGVEPVAPPGREPEPVGPGRTSDVVRVAIEAPDRCLRFAARAFQDVVVGPAPLWMRARLAAADVRAISNVVDVTNYVMVGLGNPLHAYDAERIRGGELVARRSRPGEELVTLDGRRRALDPEMLVIADAEGPSGLAGIMGGEGSEIAETTTTVVLEAANFERAGIMHTSRRLALRTEGSGRWEKGVDPYLAGQAVVWASELLVETTGGRMLPEPLDVIAGLPPRETLVLRDGRVDAVLGVSVPPAVAEEGLARLGFEPQRVDGGLQTTVPTWRRLDVTREIDLVEEVARYHGLEHVPATVPTAPTGGGLDAAQQLRRHVEEVLAGIGAHEAQTVALTAPGAPARYGLADDDPRARTVRVENPVSADYSELRTTLVPSLLEAVTRNRRLGREDVALFEIAHTYHPRDDAPLPDEPWRLGLVLAGRLGGAGWRGPGREASFFLVKGIADALAARLGLAFTVARGTAANLHPGRGAQLLLEGRPVGELGELHPRVATRFDLDGPVAVLELDLEALVAAQPDVVLFRPVPELPPLRQDIAVVVADDVAAADLLAVTREAGAPLLRQAEVFDVFRDPARLGADRVSLAVRLTFRADDRTLTEDEASRVREVVVAALHDRLGAELRAG